MIKEVTAVGKDTLEAKENVFTNIDGAVIMQPDLMEAKIILNDRRIGTAQQ